MSYNFNNHVNINSPSYEDLRHSFINIKINLENDVIRFENEYHLARDNLDKMKLLSLLKELFETKNHYITLRQDIFLLQASHEDELLFIDFNNLIQKLTALINGIKLTLNFINRTNTSIQEGFLPNNTYGGKRRRRTNKKVNLKKRKSKTKNKKRRRKSRTLNKIKN